MGPLLYVMAIMGCGDDNAACIQARVEPAQYSSLAACQREMPRGIARNTDLSFPVIAANCQAVGQQMAKTDIRMKAKG